ncbi:MAG: sensor hybrid histidine kinase [Firmicutes bacterium]|nr:sensor hybrid histidine kinase [Bacillota bacterium]
MNSSNFSAIEIGYGCAKGEDSFAAGEHAVKQAMATIHMHAISVVLVFASVSYDLNEVLAGINSIVGDVLVVGATTAGEICNKLYSETVTVTVMASPYLKVHCGVGTGVAQDWEKAVDEAISSPAVQPFFRNSEYKWEMRRQGRAAFAMIFSPGSDKLSGGKSYEILEAIKQKSYGEFPIVGGDAADDWRKEEKYVLYGRQAYANSMLIAIFETELQFGISLMHGFRPTDKTAIVTAVEENEVLALDNQVAVEVYSKLTGLPEEKLVNRQLAYINGVSIGVADTAGQYLINTAACITERGGVRFNQPISVGAVITKMEADPARMALAGPSALQLAKIRGGITNPAVGLVYYCALRPKIMGDKSRSEIAGMREVLAGKPLMGFCCFAEQGVSDNGDSQYNHSSVACLVIGNNLSHTGRVAVENRQLMDALEAQKTELIRTNNALMNEIFERMKIEEALRASETKLKDFAQAVPDISMIIDEDGRYIEVFSNKQDLNWPEIKIIGTSIDQVFPAKDAAVMLEQLKQTIISGKQQCLIHEFDFMGKHIVIEGRMAPMAYVVNEKRTVALIVVDITERQKAERMLQATYELRRKSEFLNDILAGSITVDDKALRISQSMGIDLASPLFCCLLAINNQTETMVNESKDAEYIELKSNIINLLNNGNNEYLVWDCRDGIGVLCPELAAENSLELARELKEKIHRCEPKMKVIVGVSNSIRGPESLRVCYRQAWSAVVATRCQDDNEGGIAHFRSLGIFQLLANIGGERQAAEFVQEKIGKLIDYDQARGTDFLATLEEVLRSANLKEAAEKLYIHHKTVVFRKQRIEKILGVSIDQFEVRLSLATAVKLHKLQHIINE